MDGVIDLNADLGESYGIWRLGDDEALLDVVTSANVACGFHGGDPRVMAATVRAAVERRVAIGAHISYPDLVGFGRRAMEVSPAEMAADAVYQLGALDGVARVAGGRVAYVKPHGALYHRVASDRDHARALLEAMRAYDPGLILLTLPGSSAAQVAGELGMVVVGEAFADRGYLPGGELVPRRQPGALVHEKEAVVERALRLAREGTVVAVDGSVVKVAAGSLCLHGDTPGAAALARAVREGLEEAGVALRPFSS
jgi:lactam utilization protein B